MNSGYMWCGGTGMDWLMLVIDVFPFFALLVSLPFSFSPLLYYSNLFLLFLSSHPSFVLLPLSSPVII